MTDGFVYFLDLYYCSSKERSLGKNQAYSLISTFALYIVGVNLLREHHALKSWVVLASNSLLKFTLCVFGALVFSPVMETHKDAYGMIDCSVNEALRHRNGSGAACL